MLQFFTDLLAGQNEESDRAQNEDDGKNDPIDDDASQFTSTLINNEEARDIYGEPEHCPDTVSSNNINTNISKNTIISVNLMSQIKQIIAESDNAPNLQNKAHATQSTSSIPHNHECMEDDVSIPKDRSMAHHHIQAKR